MKTASQKKRENIAEYLLYMWQIEDLIRANKLDMDKIEENIISKYSDLDEKERKELREWYESLIDMMRREGVAEQGHLQLNRNVIIALKDLHNRLISDSRFSKYAAEYYATLPIIVELRAKAGDRKVEEIETCFNALYLILLMKMQGKEVSGETLEAAKQISAFLGTLAHYYKLDYNNELFKD
ncbi:MAG: DUF4924 family protein [Muribaculaceae bacterium]|nr:DUF4924 family protein [Muribaculaceae bacterium]